jgi:hypothetical protein
MSVGEIRAGVPLMCQFIFTNSGPNAVELVEARPGCGCLRPAFEQRFITPGKQGKVIVELKTLGQPAGRHAWQLTVTYKDGEQIREQPLLVVADVVTEVSIQPASMMLYAETASSHEVTLTDLRAEPLQILDVRTTAPFLLAQAGPFQKDSFGYFTCKIKVSTTADISMGRHEEMLVIYTADPVYRELRLPITVVKLN